MRHAVRYWSRALIVPFVSMTLVVYPFPTFAATSFSLSEIAKFGGASRQLPAFALDPKDVTPLGARDTAWRLAYDYPADRYDRDALIDSLDYDSERAFEFMRDAIRFDPYRGVLRGSDGALGAQAGNAIDRALLLKDVLDDMGFESRLVYGTLPDDAARRLLTASVAKPAAGATKPLSGARLDIARAAATAYDWLVDAVADDSIGKSVAGAKIADVKDHAWVQVREGSKWVDMDPSFPDAEIGASFTKPESYATEPVVEDQYSIDITVVAESLQGGELQEDVVLEYQADTVKAEQASIFLHFRPYGAGQGRALAEALGPGAQWVPVIRVDEETTKGKRIPGIVTTPEQMTEGKKFFYGTESRVTAALYVDVRVTRPDGEVNEERRVLFDRVPSGSRDNADIDADDLLGLRMHDGKPIAYQEVHQVLVSNGGINPRTAWADAGFAAWAPERLKELNDDEMTTEQSLWALGRLQAIYPVISEGFAIPALNDLPGTRFFVGAPRVFIMTLTMLEKDEDIVSEQSIDLLLDDVQFVSVDGSATEIAQRKRWYG
ncbi:MAG: hypothetical protein KJO13_11155, partial [Gammaproteobacteria bacterium]|nr:hypothetical protein [Gammaproteobacteria bacterium]